MCVDSSFVSSCHTERAKKKLARTLLCQPINKGIVSILITGRKYFQTDRHTCKLFTSILASIPGSTR